MYAWNSLTRPDEQRNPIFACWKSTFLFIMDTWVHSPRQLHLKWYHVVRLLVTGSSVPKFKLMGLGNIIYPSSHHLISSVISKHRLISKPGSVIILGTHRWIKDLFISTDSVCAVGGSRRKKVCIVSLSIIQICKIILNKLSRPPRSREITLFYQM